LKIQPTLNFLCLSLLILISACASKSSSNSPEHSKAEIYYDKGTANLIAKKYTSAIDDLLKAFQLNPKSSKINNNLGMAYLFKGNQEKAASHIKMAIELDASNTDARSNLASIYFTNKEYDKSEKIYLDILKDLAYRAHYRTYYNLGLLAIIRKDINRAEHYFDLAIKENNDYCSAHFQKGMIVFDRGFYSKALEVFKEGSLGTCYNEPAPHYQIALTYIELKRFDDAREKLDFIMNQFSKTKYNTLAQIRFSRIQEMKDNTDHQSVKTQLDKIKQEKKSTPDF
jgi:Tfp pilus assembly protein PilF